MRLIYFDEVKYQKDKQPRYWIAGLAMTPEHIWALERSIADLSEKCFGRRTLSKETEFHATEIFCRKSNFKHWNDRWARYDIINELASILNSQQDVAKIFVCVEPGLMRINTSFEDKAFMYFSEKVDEYLRAQRSPGMLIGDRESNRVVTSFAEAFSQWREHGTPYALGKELTHLIDTVHFTDSHHSRMLQLADLYVWLLQLQFRDGEKTADQFYILNHISENTRIFHPDKYKFWPRNL